MTIVYMIGIIGVMDIMILIIVEDITNNSGSVLGSGTGSHYYYENGEIVDVAHNDISLYDFVTTQQGIDSTFDISDSMINLNVSFKNMFI